MTGSSTRGRYGRRRRRPSRRRGPGFGGVPRILGVVLVLAAVGAAVVVWRSQAREADARRDAARAFLTAWERRDAAAMWTRLTPASRERYDRERFVRAYRRSDAVATVREVRVGRLGDEDDGRIRAPVTVRTANFGALRGTVTVPVSGTGDAAGVDWQPSLRLPGLRRGESPSRREGRLPRRGQILAADGSRLDATPAGASIAGEGGSRPTGLERVYADRLRGHPAGRLLFGDRVVARARAVAGRSVRTTLRPGLTRSAEAALGGRLGGVAVIRPRDGAVLALGGLAVSAPQPPGSVFKIITLAAALEDGVVKPSDLYPVRTAATLSGVTLRNASGEACGGSLANSFAHSCNSVFAPMGAKLGAKRLVDAAREFGFGERPAIPAARPSTVPAAADLEDSLAVGSAAIGQERDLATPLQMASVAATIAAGGSRVRPRITTLQPIERTRVVPARVARLVRDMMVGVVRSGTGTGAAIPGVEVAGKTGTAELRANSTAASDANAWFVAFAPAQRPRAAVAVMLVGGGFGGEAAAPVARSVLRSALG